MKVAVSLSDAIPGLIRRPGETIDVWVRELKIDVEGGIIPTDMPALTHVMQRIITAVENVARKTVDYGTVVILSFRGPIYLHSAIANAIAGYFMAIGHYDPKIGAGVIVFPRTLAGAIVRVNEEGEEA